MLAEKYRRHPRDEKRTPSVCKKAEPESSAFDCYVVKELLFNDGLDGALVGASTAFDASITNFELAITFGDSLDGTLSSASTASDASISNLISHNDTSSEINIRTACSQAVQIQCRNPAKAAWVLQCLHCNKFKSKKQPPCVFSPNDTKRLPFFWLVSQHFAKSNCEINLFPASSALQFPSCSHSLCRRAPHARPSH